MIKKLIILLLPFTLTACDGFGSKKVKNIIDLTTKLSVGIKEPITIDDSSVIHGLLTDKISKVSSSNLTKNKIIIEPVFVNDVIYTLDSHSIVSAFSKETKTILWQYNATNKSGLHESMNGGITYSEGKLYITNGSRFLIILDSNNGVEIVRKEFPDIINIKPVMLDKHTILVQTVSNQLFAFDMQNSKFTWQHEGIFETLSSSYHVSPIVHNSQVLVSYSSGQIFSLDINTGQEQWVFNLSSHQVIGLPSFESSSVVCTPIVNADNVYIASSLGRLLKLDLRTGLIIWQINAYDIQSMSLYSNNLFVTNNARQIGVINANSGNVKFVGDLQKKKKRESTTFLSPFVTKHQEQTTLHIIAKNGEIYNFQFDNKGDLVEQAITQINKKIEYWGLSPIERSEKSEIYLITDKQFIY